MKLLPLHRTVKLDRFQTLLQALSPIDFERFVADLLQRSGRFSEVRLTAGRADQGVDVEALETDSLLQRPRRRLFQIKKARVVGEDVVRYMHTMRSRIIRSEDPTQIVLVVAGTITVIPRSSPQ